MHGVNATNATVFNSYESSVCGPDACSVAAGVDVILGRLCRIFFA